MKSSLTKWSRPLLAAALLLASQWALALTIKPFDAATLGQLQKEGKPVVVDFHADWCPTCKNQSLALEELKADPELANHTVLIADYDNVKDLRKAMKVRSQSVMVVFKGEQEVARVTGQTRAAEIKAIFVKAQ